MMIERILIVDDSLTARMMIRRCLEITGFASARFREATHGREALALLQEEEADLILTDLNMPEMDGNTLIRHLKSSPRLNAIPVIVISSITTEHEEQILRSRGVDAVIHKPMSPMTIMEAIRSLDSASEGDCHA
jgi:two-component system, chemotaxis family, chemotaxis protein CheY